VQPFHGVRDDADDSRIFAGTAAAFPWSDTPVKTLRDRVAAITGAGSGIGRATAEQMAGLGCHLALADRNAETLAAAAAACAARGVRVTSTVLDVADRAAVHAWADAAAAAHGRINVIVNNAGVALQSTLESTSYDDLEWLMGVNFWGVVHGTRAFLPHLRRAGEGHIVNLSSVFGLIAVPTQGAYNASKFAVRGYTECLRAELEVEGAPIGVTCVHPGGIKTNIARDARVGGDPWDAHSPAARAAEFDRMARTTPEAAAEAIVAAILGNRRRALIGGDAYVIDAVQRLLPTAYQRILVAVMRRRRGRGAR
jgi:NADP-dependent 3-hydroxy acid dehydrogenase YdfG